MAEAGVKAEVDLATPEAPSNPRTGVEAEATKMNTVNGMLPSPLVMVEGGQLIVSLRGPGGRVIIVVIATTPPKKDPRTGTARISPHIILKNMMIERGPEAPAPEITDIGEKEALTDTTLEESTMMKAGNTTEIMGLAQVVETTAQAEETMIMIDQDIELTLDLDTLGRTLQVKAGDTLVTIGDGDAKGP